MIELTGIDSKKIQYKHFLLKLVTLFVTVIVFDFFIGNILSYYYLKQLSGPGYQTTYAIDSTKAELLIFGSSRANHHYQTGIFENGMGLSYYNVGRDGESIFYHYAILKAVLKRYTPKMIVLDFMNGDLAKDQNSYDRISALLPYYRSHSEILPIIELKSPYEKIKLLSHIYPNNSLLLTIAARNIKFSGKKREDNNGYIPISKVWNHSIQNDNTPIIYEIDSTKIKVYTSFIQDCINSKVSLYIVCSPYFLKSSHPDYSVSLAKEIAQKYGITFFDYSQDSTFFNNQNLFADPVHLNNEGAKLFSESVTDSILLK